MNISDLVKILRKENVDGEAYSLNGPRLTEEYVLERGESGWSVYYYERGLRTGERSFPNEEDACRYLLDLLLRDPTTRKR